MIFTDAEVASLFALTADEMLADVARLLGVA
jgi:hypothetical protein